MAVCSHPNPVMALHCILKEIETPNLAQHTSPPRSSHSICPLAHYTWVTLVFFLFFNHGKLIPIALGLLYTWNVLPLNLQMIEPALFSSIG